MRMKRFIKNEKGVALIEFALILPILFLLTFPMIDYSRYILLQQKIIKTAYVLGDSITISRPIDALTVQDDPDGENGINQDATYLVTELFDNPGGADLMDNVQALMLPFRESQRAGSAEFNKFQVIVSHVRRPDATSVPQLTWQFNEDDNAFNGTADSLVGNVNGFGNTVPARLPDELLNGIDEGEGLIVVEVLANHVPITPNLVNLGVSFAAPQRLRYTSYMRTRYGDLSHIWRVFCTPVNSNC